jgi:hypothetical protein
MDWETFLASSTLATAISTAVTMLVRRRTRPEVDWAVWPVGNPTLHHDRGTYILQAKVANAGDGYAFRVTAQGVHCTAKLMGEPLAHDLIAGGTTRAQLPYVPLVEPGQQGHLEVDCVHEDWNRAEAIIEWTASPTRLRKRRSLPIPLREISPAP